MSYKYKKSNNQYVTSTLEYIKELNLVTVLDENTRGFSFSSSQLGKTAVSGNSEFINMNSYIS